MNRLGARLLRQAAAAAWRQRAGTPAAALAPRLLQHARPFHATAGRRRPLAPPLIQAIASPFRLPFSEPAPLPVVPFVAAPARALPLTQRIGQLWQAYLCSLEERPLATKAATSFVCVFLGDSLAQLIGGAPYSLLRVLRLAAYSASVGAAVGHYWHRWLEANVHPEHPTSSKAVGTKTALDQLVLSPAMLLLFFTAVKVMEGRPELIIPHIQDKYLTTLVTGWALWTPFNLASFKFIPQDLRILAGNLMGIAWGTWMSVTCINASAPVAMTACPAVAAVAQAGVM